MPLITAEQAAFRMAISRHAVWSMVRNGLLPPGVVVKLGRRVRFDSDKLTAWLEAGGQSYEGSLRREA